MSQGFAKGIQGAPADATYITNTPNPNLTAEQALSLLSSGYMKNTTGTGVVSVQATPIPIADGGTNNTAFTTNGVIFYDGTKLASTAAGTTGTVLHGNTGGAPTFSAVSLTADVTGVLPIANGGTNQSAAFTAGSIIFSDGTRFTQDNANLFWDDTNDLLLIGGTTGATADIKLGADGSAIFNQNSASVNFTVKGSTATSLFVVDGTNNRVDIGTTVQGRIAKFGATEIVFNDDAQNLDFRVESQTHANMLFVDASADTVGINRSAPLVTLDVGGGIALGQTTKTANYTATADDFCIIGNPGAGTSITITLPAASAAKQVLFIEKINASITDTVTIARAGTDTIEGATSVTLTTQYSNRVLQSDGVSSWSVLASK